MKSTVRYREDTGFEMRCGDCRTYWPMDLEFWLPRTFQRCRGCHNDRRRAEDRKAYRARRLEYRSPESIARRRERDNARKAAERRDPVRGDLLREREKMAQRRYYEAHRAEERARHREYYARWVAEQGREVRVGIGRPRLEDAA